MKRRPKTIDQLLGEARARLERVTAQEAFAEQRDGALLVDTRTYEQRRSAGGVPGAVVLDRTVFEWRLDPSSPSHLPEVQDHDARIIVLCRQGYSSSLAAASLQELGLWRATDVIGGFEAWTSAGLPVEPFAPPAEPGGV
jgi:rhodanese-related sulfurtransferase